MQPTEAERAAWQRAAEADLAEQQKRCTSPVTPANPIQPHQPGHSYSLRGNTVPPRR